MYLLHFIMLPEARQELEKGFSNIRSFAPGNNRFVHIMKKK